MGENDFLCVYEPFEMAPQVQEKNIERDVSAFLHKTIFSEHLIINRTFWGDLKRSE